MAERRDDIVGATRAQIAIEMLSPQRQRGQVTELAKTYQLSRQALYDMAAKGRDLLVEGLKPGRHGAEAKESQVVVTKNHLQRSVLTLSEQGVSQRGVVACLSEMLEKEVSLGWVNGQLGSLEAAAQQWNESVKAGGGETLSDDELFSNGMPNLLVVGNQSLYIYAFTRQEERDGETWGCVLLDMPPMEQFASDAGSGLAAGVKTAELSQHQLDWDHLLRPLWRQATIMEKQAYAALAQVSQREALFDKAHTTRRLQQHWTKWETLVAAADKKIDQLDAFTQIARQVDNCFALIDLETGQLTAAESASDHLRSLGQQLASFSGRIFHKLAANLQNWAVSLYTYQQPLRQALTPLLDQYGAEAIAALSRLWQCEADAKRYPLSWPQKERRQQIWQQALAEAHAYLGDDWLWSAWDSLSALLSHPWRASLLAECVNSLLRPLLDRRKHTDQGCLELFRFLHNVRPFLRGKRAGHSPAQLAGIDLPDDPLSWLGLAPKVSS